MRPVNRSVPWPTRAFRLTVPTATQRRPTRRWTLRRTVAARFSRHVTVDPSTALRCRVPRGWRTAKRRGLIMSRESFTRAGVVEGRVPGTKGEAGDAGVAGVAGFGVADSSSTDGVAVEGAGCSADDVGCPPACVGVGIATGTVAFTVV